MINLSNGYMLGLLYLGLAALNYSLSETMENGMKVTALVLSVMGIIHLAFKIHGTWLDNKLKQKELNED